MRGTESRTVSWWETYTYTAALLAQADTVPPVAGTAAWRALDDRDPSKLLALALAGIHHVLRMETAQEAAADASKAIAASTDWRAVATEIRQLADARRAGTRIERRRTDVA